MKTNHAWAAAARVEPADPGSWSSSLPRTWGTSGGLCPLLGPLFKKGINQLEQVKQRAPQDGQCWCACHLRRGLRLGLAQPGEEERDFTAVYSCLVGGDGEDTTECSSAQGKDSKQQGDIRAGKNPREHRKTNVHHKSEALQQGPESCGDLFRHFQN